MEARVASFIFEISLNFFFLATSATSMMNLIEVVKQCHNFDPWQDSSLKPLLLSSNGVQIGFIREVVGTAIEENGGKVAFTWNKEGSKKYWIKDDLQSHTDRSNALKRVVENWRDQGLFPDPLKGWRNELYAIFESSSLSDSKSISTCVFNLERSACALFGFVTFGVHATAYTLPDYKIWVPRRSSNKSTWPKFLDNSVAGGITSGDLPFESMVRECGEEAGLEEKVVRKVMKQTGVISYFYSTSPCNWVQPEIE